MKKKTALQLMEEHKKYENSFVKQSGASSVTYKRAGRSHTFSAMTWMIKNHLVKTLEKIKELHFEEFRNADVDAQKLQQLTELIGSDKPTSDLGSNSQALLQPNFQNLNYVISEYKIRYTLTHGEQTLATGSVIVSNVADKSKDLRRVLDTVYMSLRAKGINRSFWFRSVPFELGASTCVNLSSRSGVVLNIMVEDY